MNSFYSKCEEERKKKLSQELHGIIRARKIEEEKLILEIKQFNLRIKDTNCKQENSKQELQEAKDLMKIKEEVILEDSFKVQNEAHVNLEKKEEKQEQNPKPFINPSLIKDKTIYLTNIPMSDPFINKMLDHQKLKTIEDELTKQKLNQNSMQIKRAVNKRLMQVSNEIAQIKDLSTDLQHYKDKIIFCDYFTSKLLEQGKVQIATHKNSYKAYSYFISLVYSEDLMFLLRSKIFCKAENDNNVLKALYMIYFGALKIMKFFEEAWCFLENILSIESTESSLYVLEAFLIVLGKDMKNHLGDNFEKVVSYIKNSFFINIDNDAVKTRILFILESL